MKTDEIFDWNTESDKIYYKCDNDFSNASKINFLGLKVNVDKDGVKFDTFLTQSFYFFHFFIFAIAHFRLRFELCRSTKTSRLNRQKVCLVVFCAMSPSFNLYVSMLNEWYVKQATTVEVFQDGLLKKFDGIFQFLPHNYFLSKRQGQG